MGRICTQLLPLGEPEHRLEFMICASLLQCENGPENRFKFACIAACNALLDDSWPRAQRSGGGSNTGYRAVWGALPQPNAAGPLAALVALRNDDQCIGVLQLDDQIESLSEAQALVDAFGYTPGGADWAQPPVVIVTSDIGRWAGLHGVSSWITCARDFLGLTLSNAHLAFSSFGAPTLLSCLSIEDAQPYLGTPLQPARLVEVPWRSTDGQFVFDCEEDESIVLHASTRLAFVFLEGAQVRASRALSESLSSLPGCLTERTSIYDFIGRSALNDEAVTVLFMCTLATGSGSSSTLRRSNAL